MPEIIGAFDKLKPASKTKPKGSTASSSTATATSGVAPWVTILRNGGLKTTPRPPVKGQAGPSGGSTSGMAQVPVGNYDGYRNVVNALWSNNPAAFSSQDWTLTFQPNTTFDGKIDTAVGDAAYSFNATGQLVDQYGNLLTTMIWFTFTTPVNRLTNVASSNFSAGDVTPTFTQLWVAPALTPATASPSTSSSSPNRV